MMSITSAVASSSPPAAIAASTMASASACGARRRARNCKRLLAERLSWMPRVVSRRRSCGPRFCVLMSSRSAGSSPAARRSVRPPCACGAEWSSVQQGEIAARRSHARLSPTWRIVAIRPRSTAAVNVATRHAAPGRIAPGREARDYRRRAISSPRRRRRWASLRAIAIDEGAHGEFRCDAAALGIAETIGDGGDDALHGSLGRRANVDNAEILIVRALAGAGGKSRRDLKLAPRAHAGYSSTPRNQRQGSERSVGQ